MNPILKGILVLMISASAYAASDTATLLVVVGATSIQTSPQFAAVTGFSSIAENGSISLSFDLPISSKISLTIYDSQGKAIKTIASGQHSSGHHKLKWDYRDDSGEVAHSGLFFAVLEQNGQRAVSKIAVLNTVGSL